MTDTTKVWVALIAVAIIAIGGYFSPHGAAPTVQDNTQLAGSIDGPTTYGILGTGQIKVGSGCANGFKYSGCTGTAVNKILQGTCNITQNSPGSFAASTTALFFCPVTGAVANDNVDVVLPAGAGTPATPGEGFHVVSSFATTSNQIGIILSNDSGAATTTFKQATTGISYFITD